MVQLSGVVVAALLHDDHSLLLLLKNTIPVKIFECVNDTQYESSAML